MEAFWKKRVLSATVIACGTVLGLCSAARAGPPRACFDLPDAGDRSGRGRQSSSRPVTLADRIVADARCQYALDASGPWIDEAVKPGEEETDFATLVQKLAGPDAGAIARPSAVFARARRSGAAIPGEKLQSVFLAGCTDYLLGSGQGFALSVPVQSQQAVIERVPEQQSSCGASGLSLHFVAMEGSEALDTVSEGPWQSTLAPDVASIALKPGSWAVYAARAGAAAGLLIGRVQAGSSLTPLREALRALSAGEHKPEPWMRATWAGGAYRLEPVTVAMRESDRWAELRTAAAAYALWLATGSREPGGDPVPFDRLLLGEGGDAIALPATPVAQHMLERYGPAGKYLVPDFDDWQSMEQSFQLCLAPRYQKQTSPGGERRLPEGSVCVSLASVSEPLSLRAGPAVAGQVCVSRQTSLMTAEGLKAGEGKDDICAHLPTGAMSEARPDFILASRGDALRFSGSGADRLFVCTDNRCKRMPAEGESLALDRPGLVEIRLGEEAEQARSLQGLTLLRLGVIDPATEWHPVGLYRASGPPPDNRWTVLEHDEKEVFTYVRGRHRLDFHLSTSPTLAATYNKRADLAARMTQQIPVVGRVSGSFPGARPPVLVALATRSESCPQKNASAVRASEVVDPDRLLVDQTFHVHLAQYQGEDKPYRCISRAGFRVADAQSLPLTGSIRAGLLGDTQLVVFLPRDPALGVALPIGYVYWRLLYGFGLDGSLSLTAASTFDNAYLSRAGLGLSVAINWGPQPYAPRLLSAGVMLHLATGSDTGDDLPWNSIYGAVNLSTLVDLAGGR
jgi:hypothetical protein